MLNQIFPLVRRQSVVCFYFSKSQNVFIEIRVLYIHPKHNPARQARQVLPLLCFHNKMPGKFLF